MSVGSCRLAGNSISGRICRKLLLFLTRMGMIAVACVSKKYTTYCIAYIMHKMCSMRYSFWIQQGAVKTPKGRLVHADSIVMQSCCYQHIPQHPKGALFSWDMKRARAMGGHCHVPKTILRQCVHVKWHLIWLHVSIWIKKLHCDHEGHILALSPVLLVTSQTRISQIAFYFSAPQSSSSGDGSHSLIFLFFADWSGKWHSPVLLQPIQFKVKWCVLSEMSFCTLLLYWAVIYLWPVNLNKFCHSPLTSLMSHWGADSGSRSQSAYIIISLPLFQSYFVVSCSVKQKHSGIIFKGHSTNFRLVMGIGILFQFILPLIDIRHKKKVAIGNAWV